MGTTQKWKREIRKLISTVLFAFCVSLLFRSWEIACLITISLGLHELGHVFAIWRSGIEWELGFGPAGAWTRTPLMKREALDHYENSLIHLSGPLFSLSIAFLTFAISFIPVFNSLREFWLRVANFNALLCLLNLLPLGGLTDGGKFAKRMFGSLVEGVEGKYLAMVGGVPLIFLLIIFTLHLDWARVTSLLIIMLWFALSMFIESKLDDPRDALSARAMSRSQVMLLLVGLIVGIILSTISVIVTPFWLSDGQIYRMVDRLAFVIDYIFFESPIILKVGLALILVLTGYLMINRGLRRRFAARKQRDFDS